MDTQELLLWAAGIVITLVPALLTAKSIRRRKQIQTTSKNSVSIQAGRDINLFDD